MTYPLRRRSTRRLPILALAFTVAMTAMPNASRASGPIVVMLDQAQIVKLPEKLATIVVGNPLIADVTVQSGGLLVITGKGYGVTNLIALDRGGNILMDRFIEVQGPPDSVVVYRGVDRESYSCTPFCERRVTLGDTPDFFDKTLKQVGTRNANAQSGGRDAAESE